MKIAWISHSSQLGGAELSFMEAVRGLTAKNIEVHAILPFHGDIEDRLLAMNVKVSTTSYNWWVHPAHEKPSVMHRVKRIRKIWHDSTAMCRLLLRIHPDVVVTNTLTIPVAAIAARQAGIPHVWYIHEFGREDHNLNFDYGDLCSLALINCLSSRVIINSTAVLRKFEKHIARHKLRLIYYAVEVSPKEDYSVSVRKNQVAMETPESVLRLILVGQLTPAKRQEDAIKAVAILVQKGLNVELTLLGHHYNEYEYYITSLKELVHSLGLEEYVHFIPFTDNPHSYYVASDVVLMCSQTEAFGRVTVEAMKLGKPVVGSNTAGTAELIQDGVTGLLYESTDVNDLAAKIEVFHLNSKLIREMGCRGQEFANRTFNLENHTSALINVFSDVL
jgi:glycosyltransferase involved in cell wall biosynthesis